MGQIIQIAFELRNITQQALDDMSSDDEEEEDESAATKRLEMSNWFKFCKEKVDKIEKVWNKKLEDPDEPADEPSDPEENEETKKIEEEKDQYERQLQEMFANFGKNKNLSKSFQGSADQDPALVQARKDAQKGGSKDDIELVPKFGDNQFWKTPDMYDLDELLKEAEEEIKN